ncbi:mechanosensitive ion channel [Frigoribacterium sp. CFBP 13605]|nr:mechanosensitive ion channel [Frigoribacterium sp. CFBP 13605]NQW88495.1 mechanosensitive ion channel [Frigoribacterium sp. VKM Ac-2860]NQX08696.1 mechanosensitive ion channel [Frigoribacterium sp. VKM Ac-2859]
MWRVPIRIVAILLVAVLLRVALHFTIRRVVDQVVNGIKRKQNVDDTQALMASPLQAVRVVQRTRTLGSVLNNVVTVVVAGIALVLILGELNFNAVAIVSAAGVVGAGLAFGAQNIVKDMLNGIFMVAEDQLGVGDVVDVGPAAGVVEAVGIRVTQIRDVNGVLWFVRNGEILRVGNMSQGWTRVVIDLAVPYSADVDQVQDAMLNTANELAAIPKWRRAIIDQPEVWGIQSIAEEHVVIRIVAKTRSADRDNVDRELRSRLKKTLDAMDIVLPSLTSVVLTGFDSASSVQGARAPRTAPTPHVPRSKRK